MKSISASTGSMPRRRVIGRKTEMNSLERWLADPKAEMQLFSVSGIGGIGKSTLLIEAAHAASEASALTLWLDGLGELTTSGAFLSSLEASLESEYGRYRPPGVPLLPYVLEELSRRRTVLVMDNCERIDRIEGWLLSSFLPALRSSQVLLVVASRTGLPVKWHASPYIGTRIQSFPLNLFTHEEVLEFLQSTDLDADAQKEIARQTEGHPLLLALAVDMLRTKGSDRKLHEIRGMLSADFLREAASPALYEALTVLSLFPEADQTMLNRLLVTPIDAAGYHALGRLSFVQATSQGLSLHHVVSGLLRKDYVQRNPGQFHELRHQTFKLLAEQFHEADKRRQMGIAAHVLELYREYLPSAHAYADFSLTVKPGKHEPYQAEDLPDLHRFMAASLAQSDWQTELARAEDYDALLDDIARHCPEGICVVRDDGGAPLAFCAGVWLHAGSVPLIERYVPGLVSMLGEEASSGIRNLPPEAADSICVLLAAVDVRHPVYPPEQLGALLMQQWVIGVTSGLRGLIVTADPQLNSLLPLLGFKVGGGFQPSERAEGELTRWVLDFRQMRFEEWIQDIIRQTGPAAEDRGGRNIMIGEGDMKEALRHLFQFERLEQLPFVCGINRTGTEISRCIQQALTAEQPIYPMTEADQQLLRDSYLQKGRNKNQLADAFHMSRTTFYRHSRQAMIRLAIVMTRLLSDDAQLK